MRYLFGFACVLVATIASPLSVGAQGDEEGGSTVERQQPQAPGDPLNPTSTALQLGLDSAGLKMTPSAPLTADELDLHEADLRVNRSRGGLIGSAVFVALGAGATAWAVHAAKYDDGSDSLSDSLIPVGPIVGATFGSIMMLGGVVGMAVSGSRLATNKEDLHRLQKAQPGTSRRLQWDLETSRLVF